MAIILKGYEVKKGSFTNEKTGELVEYNNVDLHFMSNENEKCKGFFCDNVPAKMDDLKFTGAKNLDECLEHEVYFVMDPTAKVDANGKSKLLVDRILVVK